ncbi:hypothetical protein GCM10011390_12510 [Aureimonas endophytica]|uniref:SGNH hydrolase-type esterase domain-containing protein n=1 Tax=Aureimonas endophytica TaxID=2027858 RepID=A0A917E253_9HYPH|nr:SGNH family hydrolase [Aureimonas endophytica]GGD95259.1 hypothetical protein GCM10011390_12510 [Aureimonas endophytica]
MAAGVIGGKRRRSARLWGLPLAAFVLLVGDLPLAFGPVPAVAQEGAFGFFGRIFESRPRRYIEAPQPGYQPRPKYYIDPPVNRAPPSRRTDAPKAKAAAPKAAAPGETSRAAGTGAAAPQAPAPEPVAKAADAKVVLVVGDFMALSLAKGLEASVADKATIRIADRTDGSSGLARDDHFDWPARIAAIIDEEKPAAVAVMLGANDRQTIRTGDDAFALRSEEWVEAYKSRVDALAKAVRDKNVPLIWVGLPAFKSGKASDDAAYFNELYRQEVTEAGGEFVDVWDGFVDADGAFAASGPDIAGQPAKLRNSDGITMTPQGGRKLAFFAEKPLDKLFGGSLEAMPAAADPNGGKAVPQNPANASAVPAMALNSPSLDGGEALLGGSGPAAQASAGASPSPRERLVLAGAPLAPAPGRADDFSWMTKSGPVGPGRPGEAPIVSRGSVDLEAIRSGRERPVPLGPMPSLQDAIIDDWQSGAKDAPVPR